MAGGLVSTPPPPGPLPALAIHPKVKAAAMTGVMFAALTIAGLYGTGGLTLKAGILAVTSPTSTHGTPSGIGPLRSC